MLARIHIPIAAFERKELGMRAALHDVTAFDDQDLVGAPDSGKTVRDHERGPAAHEVRQALLDHGLRFRIEARCGFIENQNARIGENRPRDGKPLPLAAGKLHAAFPDDRVVALLELFGELIDARDAAGFEHLALGGAGTREHHILADGAIEQEGLLQNHAELRAVAGKFDAAEIDAIDENAAGDRFMECRNQPDSG